MQQIHIVLYAVVFIILSVVTLHLKLTTGQVLLDGAIVGVISALVSYEVAWNWHNDKKKKK